MSRKLMIPLFLSIATLSVYSQVVEFEFVNFDDNLYITDNPQVRAGVTWAGARWAFVSGHAANWHPLTWLSHMLDVQLFGLDPAGHHLTNLLLHLFNTLLLFWLLRRVTQRELASALVALFFAVHPLHVESVAWVSERKDLLAGLFAMLCMHAYASYTQNRRPIEYVFAGVFLACGLMAKPMLVTLPFVLLLLDYWPLERLLGREGRPAGERPWNLLAEKLPFFLLAAASSALTITAQRGWGAMEIGHAVPFHLRLANAVVSYVRYIGKTFFPRDLSVLYPHPYTPGGLPLSVTEVLGASTFLIGVTAVVVLARKRRYLVVGWFWFVGMLVPVSGVIQVGGQAMADRYTYLPSIGLFIIIVWGGAEISAQVRNRFAFFRPLTFVLIGIVSLASINVARVQTQVWRDSLSLLGHASAITPGNPIILLHLGAALQAKGRHEEAAIAYRQSLRFEPGNARAHHNLAQALQIGGKLDEAIIHYRKAIEIAPEHGSALTNLGAAVASQGRLEEAGFYFRRAMELDATSSAARSNLAKVLGMQGRFDDVVKLYEETLVLEPDSADIHYKLGLALVSAGRLREAISRLEEALDLDPHYAAAWQSLAATRRALDGSK